MVTLKEIVKEAGEKKVAVGHFNISNIEGLWAVFNSAKNLNLPIIIGVSEGERKFIGVKQVVALVKSLREGFNYPIFLNADHSYSFESVKEVVDAGFDAVIFDGAKLSFEENIKMTKQCVDYTRSANPNILVEGELGYIGSSSKILSEIPEGVATTSELMTTPEQSREFVEKTGIDMFAPAVGNLHGMLGGGKNPAIDIERISLIKNAVKIPLVLHGGSGISDEDFKKSIQAGISVIHINTEIRLAYKKALENSLRENRDEIVPYKIMKPSVEAMEKVITERLKLFN